MLADLALLLVGLALLVAGGRALVTGASRLAALFSVSELTIGLTVVAFGTSTPELSVNVLAASQGNSAIAFGNVVGSNIANVGLVLGACALLRPLSIESAIVSREIPMMLLATGAGVLLGLDRISERSELYDRGDGLMLLLLFGVFLYYSITEVISGRSDRLGDAAVERAPHSEEFGVGRSLGIAAVGLALLIAGGELTVAQAVRVAEALEVPRAVIGLTLVAVGTSLPEMATSLAATSKGLTSLAIGNVVGSNIFNLLFILGATAVLHPVDVPRGGAADLAALMGFSALLLVLSRSGDARITWPEGVGLLVAYLAYVAWRFQP